MSEASATVQEPSSVAMSDSEASATVKEPSSGNESGAERRHTTTTPSACSNVFFKLLIKLATSDLATTDDFNKLLESSPKDKSIIIKKDIVQHEFSVGIGEFIYFGCGDMIDDWSFGQALATQDARDVEKDQMEESNLSNIQRHDSLILIREIEKYSSIKQPPLDIVGKYNLFPTVIGEAIPTCKCCCTKATHAKEIGFIFHVSDIQNGYFNTGGMENGFAIRRELVYPGKYNYLDKFIPFFLEGCYSQRIWQNIVSIRDGSLKTLGRKGEKGRTRSHKHDGILNEFKYFFQRRTCYQSADTGELIAIDGDKNGKSKPQKVMHPDCSNENKRVKEYSFTMRALDEPALKRIRYCVGSQFGVSNPDPVPRISDIEGPKKHKSIVPMKNNTVMRITTCLPVIEDIRGFEFEVVPDTAPSSNPTLTHYETEELKKRVEKQKRAARCPFLGVDFRFQHTERGVHTLQVTE